MSRKHFSTEKIIEMLRKAKVGLAQGMNVDEIYRRMLPEDEVPSDCTVSLNLN
jgi:hypothetical protein